MELRSWTNKKVGTEPTAKSPDIGSSVPSMKRRLAKLYPKVREVQGSYMSDEALGREKNGTHEKQKL